MTQGQSLIAKIIEDKKDLLTNWDIRFQTHTIDQMLDLIKSEYINPDEAFVIGYMIGVSAEKVTSNNAEIQRKLNNRVVE